METQTTGTTPQEPQGGNAQSAPGTAEPVEADRNAELSEPNIEQLQSEVERLKQVHAQSLAEKSNYEDAKRRLAELEARVATPTTDPTQGSAVRAQEEWQEDYQNLLDLSRHSDPSVRAIARTNLRSMQAQAGVAAWIQQQQALRGTPVEVVSEAETLLRSGGVTDPNIARELAELRIKQRQPQQPAQQPNTETNGALDAARARQAAAPSMVSRGLSAAELNRRNMTRQQYVQMQDALAAQGRIADRLALKRRKDAGEINITD